MTRHTYGFSTGAIALGDFEEGLRMVRGLGCDAVELSALRVHELPALVEAHRDLDLDGYAHVSVHAPSKFGAGEEARCADMLGFCIERGWSVVLHPDAIEDPGAWDAYGAALCIENMDKRKPIGRTADELRPFFERFPEATFCLDLAHARQVDPALLVADELLRAYPERLSQVHLSQVDTASAHTTMDRSTVTRMGELAHLIPPTAIILESVCGQDELAEELGLAREALELP